MFKKEKGKKINLADGVIDVAALLLIYQCFIFLEPALVCLYPKWLETKQEKVVLFYP